MSDDHKSWIDKIGDALSREPQDRDDLLELLHDAHQRGLLNRDAMAMIEGVLQVSHMQVRDIMIPKAQMVMIESESQLKDIINTIAESGHSRFPVLSEDHEEIIGILMAKALVTHRQRSNFDINSLIRKATFIPESKRLDVLLKEFRLNKNHMAIVIDEYGGVAGLVTIEDVLEEIVGEIEDEYDNDDSNALIRQVNDQEYLVQAQTNIEDINAYFKLKIQAEDIDTIGGLVLKQTGYVPKQDEIIILPDFEVRIVKADERKIQLIKLKRPC